MKKSIVATLICTALVSISAAACGRAMAATQPNKAMPAAVVVTAARSVTDEELLTTMQSSIGVLINDYAMHGPAAPEYLFGLSAQIARANETLRQLDGQREGLAMLAAQCAATGALPPEYVFDEMSRVERARGEVLRAIGLDR